MIATVCAMVCVKEHGALSVVEADSWQEALGFADRERAVLTVLPIDHGFTNAEVSLISEQVASRMTQMGYSVLELKIRNGVYMKRNEGEFLLTREIKEVASTHNAQAVVVGTYAESATLVHVNLKIVNPATIVILAAYDYALPLDKQIASLIRKR